MDLFFKNKKSSFFEWKESQHPWIRNSPSAGKNLSALPSHKLCSQAAQAKQRNTKSCSSVLCCSALAVQMVHIFCWNEEDGCRFALIDGKVSQSVLYKIHRDGTVVEDSLWWDSCWRFIAMGQLLKIHCDEQGSQWWDSCWRFTVMNKIHCDEQDSLWWDSCWRFTVMNKIHSDGTVAEDSLWWTRFTVVNKIHCDGQDTTDRRLFYISVRPVTWY